jgi:hypothetical protein
LPIHFGRNIFTQLAYSFTQPEEGYGHVRYLLSSFPNAPEEKSLIQGLNQGPKIINETARKMLAFVESGDDASVRKNAESIMNVLAGSHSQDHKDWNKDGTLTDTSDGYGLLLNGNNLGYIQAVYAEADYAANTAGATQKMIVNGECQNLRSESGTMDTAIAGPGFDDSHFRSRYQSGTTGPHGSSACRTNH